MTTTALRFYRYLHLHHDMSPAEYADAVAHYKCLLRVEARELARSFR